MVVRTRNEEQRIELCLRSLLSQTYSSVEILVVDNHSTDRTLEICSRLGVPVFSRGPERVAQGNYGMLELASGEICAYIDADMLLAPSLAEEVVERFRSNADIVGVYTGEVVLGRGWWSHCRRVERNLYTGSPIDAARFLRRTVVMLEGGFDEASFPTPSAEDWDLDRRVQHHGSIVALGVVRELNAWDPLVLRYVSSLLPPDYEKVVSIYHDESDVRPGTYAKKKAYYSSTLNNYVSKWGRSDPLVRRQLSIRHRLIGIFVWQGRWKASLRHLPELVTVSSNRVLMGLWLLRERKARK